MNVVHLYLGCVTVKMSDDLCYLPGLRPLPSGARILWQKNDPLQSIWHEERCQLPRPSHVPLSRISAKRRRKMSGVPCIPSLGGAWTWLPTSSRLFSALSLNLVKGSGDFFSQDPHPSWSVSSTKVSGGSLVGDLEVYWLLQRYARKQEIKQASWV